MRIRLIPLLLGALLPLIGFEAAFAVPPFGIYEGVSYSPTVTVLESDAERVRLHLEMENLPPSGPVVFSGQLPGLWQDLNTTESPAVHLLPRFSIFVALPNTGNPTAVIESWNSAAYSATPINLQENSPGQPQVIVGNVGILNGVRVVPLTVKPIKYTNNAAACSVMTSAVISLEIDGSQGVNPVTNPRSAFSRPWQKIFAALVVNHEHIPNIGVGAESHILMIVPGAYAAAISEFRAWKEQRGTKVTVVLKNSIGANPTADQIRSRIISEVDASMPRIDHVILVGDETQLAVSPLYTADPITRFSNAQLAGSYTNENHFAAIEGTDVFPDLFVGRWVVNTEAEVYNIVAKQVLHERDPFVADTARFERVTVSADNTELTQRITKRNVARMMALHGFTSIDSVWAGQGAQPMITAVNQGRAFVNYRGSGWNFGWAGIQFYVNQVDQLDNTRKLPIVTGIGCGVAKFDEADGQCFGERWMLHGTISQPKGAAGFIGPCWNTHTVYNDCLDSLLYRSFLDYDVLQLMPALVAGKMMSWAVLADFLDESPVLEVTNTMMRQYIVMSDPSLQLYTDTPRRVQVSLPDVMPGGLVSLTAVVNNMSALAVDSLQVTAWMGNGQFVTGWIPAGSTTATLLLNTQNADTLIVTFTGDNVLAYQQGVSVGPYGPFIVHQGSALNDTQQGNGDALVNPGETLHWTETVRNIGSEAAIDMVATLATTDPGVTITQPTVSFGAVDSGQTSTASAPFTIMVAPNAEIGPRLPFAITYSMSNGPNQQSVDTLQVYVPRIELESIQVIDDNNNFWDRNEAVNFRISVTNAGSVELSAGTYAISSADPLITVLSDSAGGPQIDAGAGYTFADNTFMAHASYATPAGFQATLVLNVSADMGTYIYAKQIPFTLTVGHTGSTDPMVDNIRHYWIYDNTDTEYSEHPAFDWVEIAPAVGGPGTIIPYTAGDQTYAVPVPFSFNYYGVTYDSLSISTDGWIRAGRTLQTNRFNFPLPLATDNIHGMIALLWFNLRQPVGETGQICYYYDQASDRFIAEWYQVHDVTGVHAETFQVQLLNPATYPTESGEAEWIILYQELSSRVNDPGIGATVGIENLPETAGMTYVHKGNLTAGAAELVAGRALKLTTEPPEILSATTRGTALPTGVELYPNYPNPFNPETTIGFALPRHGHAFLCVYDLLGRRVATLANAPLQAGTHLVGWRGAMDNGVSAPSGVYFYRLEADGVVVSRKMILLR